jgi:hypothetical protein
MRRRRRTTCGREAYGFRHMLTSKRLGGRRRYAERRGAVNELLDVRRSGA